jgi:hypothetical protein
MCSSAPAPDPGIGLAAQTNAAIAKETLDWYKAKDAELKPARDAATKLALDQAAVQTETAKKQNAMADETYEYTKNTFRPLEQKIAADAIGYDTPERRDAAAADVQGGIGLATDAATANMAREVTSRGGDVNSGNFQAGLATMGALSAAQKAGAGNQARKNVEAIGGAKVADAASLGRGISSTNSTQTQLGLQAGNSAIGASQQPMAIGARQGNMMAQGAGIGIQGNSAAGNLLLGEYNAQTNAQQAANSGTNALIGASGNAGGMWLASSDKKIKNSRKKVDPKLSLAAIKRLPVESWKYNKGSVADDGGKTHVGPMAQEVKKGLGDGVAPQGKMIDMVSMSGHQTNAIKAIDAKVEKIALSLKNMKKC